MRTVDQPLEEPNQIHLTQGVGEVSSTYIATGKACVIVPWV